MLYILFPVSCCLDFSSGDHQGRRWQHSRKISLRHKKSTVFVIKDMVQIENKKIDRVIRDHEREVHVLSQSRYRKVAIVVARPDGAPAHGPILFRAHAVPSEPRSWLRASAPVPRPMGHRLSRRAVTIVMLMAR